ncbi:MAG: hypothetical protein P8P74_14580 [Crocinitomicaceae bacterium]|nr:hypothetical protein [Crocinitomicaceae bacterium]
MKNVFVLAACLTLILSSCGEEKRKVASSNPDDPSGTRNIIASTTVAPVIVSNPEEFQLRGNHARLIRTEQGTRIHVPSNAFVNKATGDPIDGNVVLTFNEYHTQGEILASGIPMNYVSPDGDTVNFESAGMFDIRAFQGDAELELAQDKEIEVELATNAGGTFEFYAFNEGQENWELKDTECNPIPNPYIPKQKMELEKLEEETPETPKKLIEYKLGDPLFDVKRYGAHDKVLDALNGVFWKFTGDSTQIDPSKDNATFNKNYDFVELKSVDSSNVREYDMVFRDGTEEVIVRAAPIFQGKLLTRENDRMARILDQIDYALRSKAQIEEELAQEKALMRMMNIDGMGIYNYDRQWKDDGAIPFIADFTFEGERLDRGVAVYLLPKEKRVVIKYVPSDYEKFAINPNESNSLLAISPKEKVVYVLSAEDIRRMNISNKNAGGTLVFDLKKHGDLIEDSTKVDELIATL